MDFTQTFSRDDTAVATIGHNATQRDPKKTSFRTCAFSGNIEAGIMKDSVPLPPTPRRARVFAVWKVTFA